MEDIIDVARSEREYRLKKGLEQRSDIENDIQEELEELESNTHSVCKWYMLLGALMIWLAPIGNYFEIEGMIWLALIGTIVLFFGLTSGVLTEMYRNAREILLTKEELRQEIEENLDRGEE